VAQRQVLRRPDHEAEERLVRQRKGRTTNTCRQCGNEFTQPACRKWRDHYCSRTCSYAHLRAKQVLPRPCATCGKEFTPRLYQLKQGVGKFCSQQCNTTAMESLVTPEAQAKALKTRAEKLASGATVRVTGEKHPQWMGGSEASRRRRTASGQAAAARRRYRAANPEKTREWAQSRRGIGRIPRGTVKRLRAEQKDACAYCGRPIPPYHLDHKLPVCRGGRNDADNLHLTCPTCNLRKSALTHEEFLVSKRRPVYRKLAA
jgi:5-methylcytosine-specific restriction endonuclease McrA